MALTATQTDAQTATKTDADLVAHVLRRAGFGADKAEIARYAALEYDEIVDRLVNPEGFEDVEDDLLGRYYPHIAANKDNPAVWNGRWIYRMLNTDRPLQEKMTLFWHGILATGWTKSEHTPSMVNHIEMLRTNCLANFRTILVDLSRDPAMIFWLDNNENHGSAINENYGREILELFSMGIGNYSEDDIKNAARAFTGWTFKQPLPLYPFGHFEARFIYREDDHDDGEKEFLGHRGRFNGEDIIDIIAQQEATARFVSRHLYSFFVADEAQVPAWSIQAPRDPDAIQTLVDAWFESDADIRHVMSVLLKSDFFKEARYQRVKSPTEFVANVLKISGDYRYPDPGLESFEGTLIAMGQKLMDPPTVEGWHAGKEWIDGGTLTERVNFAVETLADTSKPGFQELIATLKECEQPVSEGTFVEAVLRHLCRLEVSDETRATLQAHAITQGELDFENDADGSEKRVLQMLNLAVATREFQFE